MEEPILDLIPIALKNVIWRKIVWHTDPDDAPLGPYRSAEVYCCEESNGYSVWYVRKLARNDTRGLADVVNADYLLDFFGPSARDAAIERAVLLATSGEDIETILVNLDTIALESARGELH